MFGFASSICCPTPALIAFMALLSAAFCCSFARAQADPKLEDDLFLRNLLLRQYLLEKEGEAPAAAAADNRQVHNQQRLLVPSSVAAATVFGIVSQRGQQAQEQQSPALAVATGFWPRPQRTSGAKKRAAKLFRFSDQYTPTPCRWKLCASIFKGADLFRR